MSLRSPLLSICLQAFTWSCLLVPGSALGTGPDVLLVHAGWDDCAAQLQTGLADGEQSSPDVGSEGLEDPDG